MVLYINIIYLFLDYYINKYLLYYVALLYYLLYLCAVILRFLT